mmetsp:Transcript_45639/g.145657  ORF Transcript_45639/g.145657 Transcript_45639/m.145657 type:complete len:216 (-) Transcript_45639:50-697(-)
MQQVWAYGMTPRHVAPLPAERIVLEEEVVLAFVVHQPIGVIQPIFRRCEVELRTAALAIQLRWSSRRGAQSGRPRARLPQWSSPARHRLSRTPAPAPLRTAFGSLFGGSNSPLWRTSARQTSRCSNWCLALRADNGPISHGTGRSDAVAANGPNRSRPCTACNFGRLLGTAVQEVVTASGVHRGTPAAWHAAAAAKLEAVEVHEAVSGSCCDRTQ